MSASIARAILTTTAAAIVLIAVSGCAATPAAPHAMQPDVDEAVAATLPEDVESAVTIHDAESDECLTTVTLLPYRYGLTAAMLDDAIDLLRDGGENLGCRPVLRVVDSDGEQVDLDHIAQYLPVEAREGDVVILD